MTPQGSMNPKTTKWAVIASVGLAFVIFASDQVSHIPYAGPWLMTLAKFAAVGGMAKLGIEARDR